MRQRYIALTAGIAFAAAAALSVAGGVDRAYAADDCNKTCKPAFSFCKDRAKTQFNDAKPDIAAFKQSCKQLDKDERHTCLQIFKDTKKAAKQAKKDQLKACKDASKCRSAECKNLAGSSGEDTCSPTGDVVGSPGDSFQDCHETHFID